MTRLATEVRPKLEAIAARLVGRCSNEGQAPVRQRVDLGDVPGHVGRSPVITDDSQGALCPAYAVAVLEIRTR